MRNFYKTIMMLVMTVGLLLTISTPLEVMAGTINVVNANVSSNKITVSGTTEEGIVACVILVYDQLGTTLQTMETCAVAGDNTYSYTLTQEFAAGSYLIKAADYEGGEYASTTVVIDTNTPGNNGNNQNSSNPSDDKALSDTSKKDSAPKTGDNTSIVWPFILTIISGAGLLLTGKKARFFF